MTESQATLCKIINQLHGIEDKTKKLEGGDRLSRKFDRTKKYFEEIDLYIHDPLGEDYSDTRIDCEATISGDSTNDLKIVEVIKPLIFNREGGQNVIIQRAVVIVEGR